jgi:hypothetical protein
MANRRDGSGKHDAIIVVTCPECKAHLLSVAPDDILQAGPFRWIKDDEGSAYDEPN